MIDRLNFKNVSVQYDKSQIENKKIKLVNFIYVVITVFAVIAVLTLIFGFGDKFEDKLWLLAVISTLFIFAVVSVLIIIDFFVEEKLIPKNYRFITWLKKFNRNSIEAGFFNDSLIVMVNDPSGSTQMHDLNSFIGCSIECVDKSSKTCPIKLDIDLTKSTPRVTIEDKTAIQLYNSIDF